jgi:transglutaminase-like putative cysteine protease
MEVRWRGDCVLIPHGRDYRQRPLGPAIQQCSLEAWLIALRIRHQTTYAYRRPVSLGPHRLMLRPRESRDLRLISSEIKVTPEGALTWAEDVFGNAVARPTTSAR